MKDLEKIFGSERFGIIKNLVINPLEVTIFNSVIFKKDENDNNPIYITHTNLPAIIEDESELISPLSIEEAEDSYIIGDYLWDPIDYSSIIFSNLIPTDVLGDIILLTKKQVFELTNVSLDDDRLFYDEAIELNN